MPVHPHHRPERLEPERIAQAREEGRPAIVVQHAFGDGGAERHHPRRQPGGHAAAVEREVREPRPFHALIVHRVSWFLMQHPALEYQDRLCARQATYTTLDRQDARVSHARVGVFALGVALAILAAKGTLTGWWVAAPLA